MVGWWDWCLKVEGEGEGLCVWVDYRQTFKVLLANYVCVGNGAGLEWKCAWVWMF